MHRTALCALTVMVLFLSASAKNKKEINYKAYSGPALLPDQVATLDPGILEITLDGHDTAYEWDSGSLREGCKAQKRDSITDEPFRCSTANLRVRVLPGRHTMSARILFAEAGIRFTPVAATSSGPDCTPTFCRYTMDVVLEAGKTYNVWFVYVADSGGIAVVESRKDPAEFCKKLFPEKQIRGLFLVKPYVAQCSLAP